MTVEDHTPRPDDDGRGGDMGRVGEPVERTGEPVETLDHQSARLDLAGIRGQVIEDVLTELGD
jgi:hypothetical protein